MNPAPVVFNNTVLRDGHQSLAATRMSTAQMLPAAPLLDSLGFGGLETWGGATIDACLRYLGENPFERLRALKAAAPRTPHIMLLRGQNIVQYASFPDDVVEAFVRCAAAAGCDVFRVFDALNDARNLATAIRAVRAAGRTARGEICYTASPVHTLDRFVAFGEELAALGCHTIGIKDMSGILAPAVAAELVRRLKARTGLPVVVHSHDTAGFAAAAYYAAIEAGADAVETSIQPFADGTAQPDTQRMLALLEHHPRCPHFDRERLLELRRHFEKVYAELGSFTSHANERTDPDVPVFQIPGGMISNFRTQLRELGMANRLDEVLAEIPHVRRCLGWIPLVTPTSQIVGTQAMLNVKFGRWKNIAGPTADVLLGKYGRTPGPVYADLLHHVEKQSGHKRSDERQADLLPPRMSKLKEELRAKGFPDTDEMAVLHAMFPQELAKLLAPASPPSPVPTAPRPAALAPVAPPPGEGRHYQLTVEGRSYSVDVEERAG